MMESNKIPFHEVIRGHTLEGLIIFQISDFAFKKNSSLYYSELKNLASIAFILQRKIVNQLAKTYLKFASLFQHFMIRS